MEQNVKQQIVERVKQATNILVTVSNDPSVDQLAAAIGLTLLLNKMDKHATAVFSGQPPSTLEFLRPEDTLEQNTDSLRDFIISLDKSKADKLRYKVEDQVVRIFITPYRTSLSEKDLVFSQGDFNVEVVLALGVSAKEHLDGAITAHGRILHDATVVTLNAGPTDNGDLGQLNFTDPSASSLCEMIVSLSESFGSGLIDNQMATAFLTGIVAQTERFRNDKTSPKVMTMSAQLMAAGANQQLIASKLEEEKKPEEPPQSPDGTPPPADNPVVPLEQPPASPDGLLTITHPAEPEPEVELNPHEIKIDDRGQLKSAQDLIAEQDAAKAAAEAAEKQAQSEDSVERKSLDPNGEPSRGGELTANTKQEALSPTTDALSTPVHEDAKLFNRDQQPVIAPLGEPIGPPHKPLSLDDLEASDKTLEQIEGQAVEPPQVIDSARDAVSQAVADAPTDPGRMGPIESLNAQPLGEINHDQNTPLSGTALPPVAPLEPYMPNDTPTSQPLPGGQTPPPGPPPPPGLPSMPPPVPPPLPPQNGDFSLPFPPPNQQ